MASKSKAPLETDDFHTPLTKKTPRTKHPSNFPRKALWPTESDNLETILEKHETAEGVESVTDMPADDSDNYVSLHPPPLEKPNTSILDTNVGSSEGNERVSQSSLGSEDPDYCYVSHQQYSPKFNDDRGYKDDRKASQSSINSEDSDYCYVSHQEYSPKFNDDRGYKDDRKASQSSINSEDSDYCYVTYDQLNSNDRSSCEADRKVSQISTESEDPYSYALPHQFQLIPGSGEMQCVAGGKEVIFSANLDKHSLLLRDSNGYSESNYVNQSAADFDNTGNDYEYVEFTDPKQQKSLIACEDDRRMRQSSICSNGSDHDYENIDPSQLQIKPHSNSKQSILETVADSSASDMKDTASGSESSRHSIQSDDSFVFISQSTHDGATKRDSDVSFQSDDSHVLIYYRKRSKSLPERLNEISLDCDDYRISESPKRESCADQSSIDPVENDNGYVTSPCLNSPVNFNVIPHPNDSTTRPEYKQALLLSALRFYKAAEVMSSSIYLRLSPFEDSMDVPVYRKYKLLRTLFKKCKRNHQNLVDSLTNTLGSTQGQVVRLLKCFSLNEREFEKQRCQAEHKALKICSILGIKCDAVPTTAFMQSVADRFHCVWLMLGALLGNDEDKIAGVCVQYHEHRPGYPIVQATVAVMKAWSDHCLCKSLDSEHTCLTVLTALVLLGKEEAMICNEGETGTHDSRWLSI